MAAVCLKIACQTTCDSRMKKQKSHDEHNDWKKFYVDCDEAQRFCNQYLHHVTATIACPVSGVCSGDLISFRNCL